MKRDNAIDSDGSEDIGGTTYPISCPRCKSSVKLITDKKELYQN